MLQMDAGQLNQRCSLSGARVLIGSLITLGNVFPKTVYYGVCHSESNSLQIHHWSWSSNSNDPVGFGLKLTDQTDQSWAELELCFVCSRSPTIVLRFSVFLGFYSSVRGYTYSALALSPANNLGSSSY